MPACFMRITSIFRIHARIHDVLLKKASTFIPVFPAQFIQSSDIDGQQAATSTWASTRDDDGVELEGT